MSINTDFSAFNNNPVDVLPIIFKNLSLETDTVALVCKQWKEIVDSEKFREMIRPPRVMGIKQLIEHNPNIIFEGKEHPLPRKFYKEYAEEKGLCFFNPGKVKLKMANGECKLVVLNSLEAIASLFPNPNLKTRFTNDALKEALQERRKNEEDPHWVWEEARACGFDMTYEEQLELAKNTDKAFYPERYQATKKNSVVVRSRGKPKASKSKQIVVMSNANDHVLGKFMAEAILGERKVTWDPGSSKYGLIRVKNKIKKRDVITEEDMELSLSVGVAPSGIYIYGEHERLYYYGGDISHRFSFVCARKSFST